MFERKEYEEDGQVVRSDTTIVEHYSAVRRQYLRAREYCGFTLDELINSRSAQRYLSEVWLLGCMVRKPRKAHVLPDRIRIGDVMPDSPTAAEHTKGTLERRR
jgi:hypothetical protein